MEKIIEIKQLKMSFNGKDVLSNINFTVNKGEIIGLVGPSGAGKTTLINILTGLLNPTSGEVLIFNTNIKNLSKKQYSKIGFLFDSLGLFERLTCVQNLSIYADIHKINKKQIDYLLNEVNLLEYKRNKVSKLSKGMKQRLAFARSILHSPSLLFLDEPTSGLDPLNSLLLENQIMFLKGNGTTIFLSSHKMNEVMRICDRVFLLNKGVLIEMTSDLRKKYDFEDVINITLKSNKKISLPNNEESYKIISQYMKDEQIISIHSSEPDLETIFMSIVKGETSLWDLIELQQF